MKTTTKTMMMDGSTNLKVRKMTATLPKLLEATIMMMMVMIMTNLIIRMMPATLPKFLETQVTYNEESEKVS